MELSNHAKQLYDRVVTHRRALHGFPEISDREIKTSAYVCDELKKLGLKFKKIHTGVVCDIAGGEKTTLAFRADMDALPIIEKTGREFASKNGCMHACGHDGHTAMLLAVAEYFSLNKPKHSLRLIFQYGEEGTGGAEVMVAKGCLDGVDKVFAFHVCPFLEQGKISTDTGAIFAGAVEFDVSFYGKASHCAAKADGADSIAALNAYLNFLPSANAKFASNSLLHVGKIGGGNARNIVAASSVAECTLRYFDENHKEEIMMNIANFLTEGDNANKTSHRLTVSAVYPPLINSGAAVAKLKSVVPNIEQCTPQYTAEDFAFMAKEKFACMAWLGIKTEKYFSPLHSDTFDFDETALLYGIDAYIKLANS